MTAAYAAPSGGRRHPLVERRRRPLSDSGIAAIAIAVVGGVWLQLAASTVAVAAVAALLIGVVQRCPPGALLCAVLVVGGAARSHQSWQQATPRHLGPYTGWVELIGDPAPFGPALRVTMEIEGERFDAWCYGSVKRRLAPRQSGEQVYLSGRRTPSTGHVRRSAVRHVVGRFTVSFTGDTDGGSPLDQASARVRAALRRGAERTMPSDDAALFTGLVIGDDARESPAMINTFRAAGLSHLTAVSGQNLVFVLAAASPLLKRLRPAARWAASAGLIGWFMALTRFEPSVLRAGVMALLAVSAFALGRRQSPVRLLGLAVVVLVLADPMLVWSVGFWLSVGATAGVCVVGPWLASRLPGPSWWRVGLGVTLGAQVGVVVPSVLVFHRLPLVSVPVNLLAVPVAGLVMLWGIPTGLVAAFVPGPLATVVMWPAAAGTRWVSTVAVLGARLEPSPRWAVAGWVGLAVGIAGTLAHRRAHRAPPVGA